jgi:hypothetical protein
LKKAGSPRDGSLRPARRRRPLRVEVDAAGRPLRVHGRRGPVRIVEVREVWRIDDEWWRNPISRDYYEVVLDSGRLLTLHHDRVEGRWYL